MLSKSLKHLVAVTLSLVLNTSTAEKLYVPIPLRASIATLSPGGIPMLMYHVIGCSNNRLAVCPDSLYEQLVYMHNQEFRAITIDEYLSLDFSRLNSRERPYMLTFDDSHETQFTLSNGRPRHNSAVGVIERFRTTYNTRLPAYFYIVPGRPLFGNPEQELEKLEYLVTNDFGIGNHTYTHSDLSLVQSPISELRRADRALAYLIGADWNAPRTAAFPYGALPSDSMREQLARTLSYSLLFHAYGGLAKQPADSLFDVTAVNRYEINSIGAGPGGILFFLRRFQAARVTKQ